MLLEYAKNEKSQYQLPDHLASLNDCVGAMKDAMRDVVTKLAPAIDE